MWFWFFGFALFGVFFFFEKYYLYSISFHSYTQQDILTFSLIWDITYKVLTLLSIKVATLVSRESAGRTPS